MSNIGKKILCGDDLLNCDPSDYKNVPLEVTRQSETIGIATDDNGAYYVYQKGERNAIDWKKPFDSFDSALEFAKSAYSDYLAYLVYLYGENNEVKADERTDIDIIDNKTLAKNDNDSRIIPMMDNAIPTLTHLSILKSDTPEFDCNSLIEPNKIAYKNSIVPFRFKKVPILIFIDKSGLKRLSSDIECNVDEQYTPSLNYNTVIKYIKRSTHLLTIKIDSSDEAWINKEKLKIIFEQYSAISEELMRITGKEWSTTITIKPTQKSNDEQSKILGEMTIKSGDTKH